MRRFFAYLLLILPSLALDQSQHFTQTLRRAEVGKRLIKKSHDSQSEQIYLGSIMNSEGEILYHVIRECVTFLASTQIRKRSRIIFFDQQQHQVAEYRVGLPEELPFKLSNNTLYFRNKGTAHQEVLGSELQETLCVSAEECYWKE